MCASFIKIHKKFLKPKHSHENPLEKDSKKKKIEENTTNENPNNLSIEKKFLYSYQVLIILYNWMFLLATKKNRLEIISILTKIIRILKALQVI